MTIIRDDLTIQDVTISASGMANAVSVTFLTRYNIFRVTLPTEGAAAQFYVKLPADSDTAVGDLAEFHVMNRSFSVSNSDSLVMLDNSGASFYPDGPELSAYYGISNWTAVIRKVDSGKWRIVG